jgi:DNA-binding Lrp family transcriptional regulator
MPINVPLIEKNVQTQATPAATAGPKLGNVSNPYVKDKSFEAAGAIVQGQADYEYDRYKKTAILEAENMLNQWENQNLYGEQGALNRKGSNAFGVDEEYSKKYSEDIQTFRSNLRGEDVIQAFDNLSQSRYNNVNRQLKRHSFTEKDKYFADSMKAAVDSSLMRAENNAFDDGVVGDSINSAISAYSIWAESQGKPREEIKVRTAQLKDEGFTKAISARLDSDPMGAKAFFDKVKGQMSGGSVAKISKALEVGTTRATSQANADAIVNANMGEGLDTWLKEARAIKDPKVRDETVMRVKTRWSEKEQIDKIKSNKDKADAWSIVVNGKNTEGISNNLWNSLDAETQKEMQSYADKNGEIETDLVTYADLRGKALSNPKEFADENLSKYLNKLDERDFRAFVELQQTVRKNNKSIDSSTRTINAIAVDRLQAVGVDTGVGADDKDKQRTASFYRTLSGRIEADQEELGRKLKESEVEDIIDNLLVKGELDGSGIFSDDDAFAFEGAGKENFLIEEIGQIPEKQVLRYQNLIAKKKGIPVENVSDDEILDLYIQSLRTYAY